jgi:hypothetical protein
MARIANIPAFVSYDPAKTFVVIEVVKDAAYGSIEKHLTPEGVTTFTATFYSEGFSTIVRKGDLQDCKNALTIPSLEAADLI